MIIFTSILIFSVGVIVLSSSIFCQSSNDISYRMDAPNRTDQFLNNLFVNTLPHCSYSHLYIFVLFIGKGRALESITSEGESTHKSSRSTKNTRQTRFSFYLLQNGGKKRIRPNANNLYCFQRFDFENGNGNE